MYKMKKEILAKLDSMPFYGNSIARNSFPCHADKN